VRAKATGSIGRTIGYGHTINLNRCQVCGTHNPTIPGEGIEHTCSGCGAKIEGFADRTVSAKVFTPPKKLDSDAVEDANDKQTRRLRIINQNRLAKSMVGKSDTRARGIKPVGERKTRNRHRSK